MMAMMMTMMMIMMMVTDGRTMYENDTALKLKSVNMLLLFTGEFVSVTWL